MTKLNVVCAALLLVTSSGCASFEQALEEAGIARFDGARSRRAVELRVGHRSGRGAVVGHNRVLTVEHVVGASNEVWVATRRKAGWVRGKVVQRISAHPEPIVVVEIATDTGLYGQLLGFSGFGTERRLRAGVGAPARILTARGALPLRRNGFRPGDSGSPVLDSEGDLVGLLSGFDRVSGFPVYTSPNPAPGQVLACAR